jgi:hypothetical protein
MNFRETLRNICVFNKSSTNSIWDGRNKSFLGWFFCIVNTKYVLTFWFTLKDFSYHSSQISDVNGRNKIITLTNNR